MLSRKQSRNPHLLLRVDAGSRYGFGHFMRSLALAQAWQDRGYVASLAMAVMASDSKIQLESNGIHLDCLDTVPGTEEDAQKTVQYAHRAGANTVVVDGYHFAAHYLRCLRDAGLFVLLVDDVGGADDYPVDVILNQNITAQPQLYQSKDSNTHLLLGTSYILLRREFRRWQHWKRTHPGVGRKVMVTMGGSDSSNATELIVRSLQRFAPGELECRIVIGAANPNKGMLLSQFTDTIHAIHLLTDVTDLSGLMAWTDVAISAAGSTCWELAYMKAPFLDVILADNQHDIAIELEKQEAADCLGWDTLLTEESVENALRSLLQNQARRRALAQTASALVDGLGADRVVDVLLDGRKL